MSQVVVRASTPADLPALGRLAAQLVRLHHGWDAQRFLVVEPIEEGYRWWLGREQANPEAVVLVAELPDQPELGVIGYAYGRLEERDWNMLLDAHGALHDVLVDPAARRRGVASALVREMLARLEALGAPRVVLHSASANVEAQALFRSLGFRPTMVEMTRERGS